MWERLQDGIAGAIVAGSYVLCVGLAGVLVLLVVALIYGWALSAQQRADKARD